MPELIVALDLPSVQEARAMAALLAGGVSWLKVGLELFVLAGPSFVAELKRGGFKVFLDLKFYDIPHTVARATAAAASTGADLLTLHCQGGEKMCRAAREALAPLKNPPLLFGVTVLTSFSAGEMPGIPLDPARFAARLAQNAQSFGLDGVVCSAWEAAPIKAASPGLLTLAPGIRPCGSDPGDQARVATPAQAVAAGADYLVVGRPVLKSPDPALAVQEILREMREADSGTAAPAPEFGAAAPDPAWGSETPRPPNFSKD